MEWIEGNSDPRVSAKKVIMVHVGFGLDSDSDWWIVGAYLPGYDEIWTWLTQRPMIGPGAPWIIVSEGTMKTWGGVSWKDDRLVRGLKAQDTAITCLGGKPLSSGRY